MASNIIRVAIATLALMLAVSLPAQAADRWVGVFIPQQDILVDNYTRGKTADEYFMPLWGLYENRRISGGVSQVRLFLLNGRQQTTIFNGRVDGHKYVSVDRRNIGPSTLLCVEVPWPIIAHQRVAAGERVMCERGVDSWFRQGRGKTSEDAWGVIAIKPAGL